MSSGERVIEFSNFYLSNLNEHALLVAWIKKIKRREKKIKSTLFDKHSSFKLIQKKEKVFHFFTSKFGLSY